MGAMDPLTIDRYDFTLQVHNAALLRMDHDTRNLYRFGYINIYGKPAAALLKIDDDTRTLYRFGYINIDGKPARKDP